MIIALLFFLVLFVIGISFIINGVDILYNFKAIGSWEMVEGQITHVKYKGEWFPVGEALTIKDELEICYEFETNDQIIQCTRISPSETKIIDRNIAFSNGFYAYHIQDFYNSIIKNPKVYVWINPKNYLESIVINNPIAHVIKIYIGIVLIIWSLGFTKFIFQLGSIDISNKIEVIEEKNQIEKDAFDKGFYNQ